MTSLFGFHWGWLFGALVIGVIVGAMTWQKIRLSWLDRWVHIVLAVVAIAIVVALLKLVHGRAGYWLDLALWTLVPYVVGCFVGWALRGMAELPSAADAMQALAAARPPEGKSFDSYTGPLETTYVNKPGETPLYRPGSGIVDPRTAMAQSPEWDSATTAKGASAPTGTAATTADGTPLETPYVSKPGQTPLFVPGSGIVDYRTALGATVAKAGETAGTVAAPAAGVAAAAKAKGVAGSAGTVSSEAGSSPSALADTTGRLGDAAPAALAGEPVALKAAASTEGTTSVGSASSTVSPPAAASVTGTRDAGTATATASSGSSAPAAGAVAGSSSGPVTGAAEGPRTAGVSGSSPSGSAVEGLSKQSGAGTPSSTSTGADAGSLPPMATSDATESLPPSPGQTPPAPLSKDAALASSGAGLVASSTSGIAPASPASGVATPSGAGATPADPPAAAPVPNEDQHAGERPKGFADARGGKADDLKRIKGIGPQNEGRLHGLGIWHFDQIAVWTPDNVKWVGSYLAFHGRIDREKWIEQAKALAAGQDTEFSRRVAAGKVATSRDDGSLGQHNIDTKPPHTKS